MQVSQHVGLELRVDQSAETQTDVLAALFRCFTGRQHPKSMTQTELVELLKYFGKEKDMPRELIEEWVKEICDEEALTFAQFVVTFDMYAQLQMDETQKVQVNTRKHSL
jgi:uncharacterized protein YpbB